MARRGKKYQEALKAIEPGKLYEPDEALDVLCKVAYAGFDETVETAIRLGVDPRHADSDGQGRCGVAQRHRTRSESAGVCQGRQGQRSQGCRSGLCWSEDLAEKIQGGWLEFDRAVATPDMMSVVGRLGRILGPRGLMPNPRTGTVTNDLAAAIKEIKQGKVDFRTDRVGLIHARIGKVSFGPAKLLENFYVFMDAIVRAKPPGAKGQYIKGVSMASSMGPGIPLNVARVTRPKST